jgi:glutamine amidotransferase
MLLEPMYLLMGRNFEHDETSYDFEECTVEEATAVIFASEPLTERTDDWATLEFGEIVFLEKKGEKITRSVSTLKV